MANADLLDIFNDAIGNIGAKTSITATTEQSAEAAICAMRYEGVVKSVLREVDWNCLRTRAALEEPDTAAVWPPSWSYLYLYPTDCLALRGFDLGYGGGYRPACDVPHEVANDTQMGKVILTNTLDPTAVYTAYTVDLVNAPYEAKFDASLREAVGWALSAVIAGPLTGNAQIISQARGEAARVLEMARTANIRENGPNAVPDVRESESLAVRGYCGVGTYPYPYSEPYPWPGDWAPSWPYFWRP